MIPQDKSLEIVVNYMDIHRHYYSGCIYDELVISDGSTSNSTCGKSIVNSRRIFFTKENINVSFRSAPWSNSLSGFLLTYKIIDGVDIHCTFENNWCNFTKIGDWKRVMGSNLGNWSIEDHTIGNSYGHFVILETSILENVKNGIIKRNLTANGKLACLNFWYQSYGYTSNVLKIFVLVNGRKLLLWNSTLGTTTSWEKGRTTIYLNYNRFSIIFEAMVNSYPGYISLDDILVDIGECNSPGDCSFENGISNSKCLWRNVGFPLDNYNWIVHSGSTSYYGTGPSFDRKGSTTGKYIYMRETTEV
ncbi:MAM and LDL-receptor class A domain-containing protein 1-like [Xenia sp. Carnegie-2017]|uniref:MAM and LDL-receptor class A domain-containing protein 1-like n=1 Tax=Xenia sp. Carnegie-2017 TaxID=2897299 RepID=UPI001F03515F|nr:MAM and LDL-receptor class A domain-containing protein 1-like [Xenia sp. Carnegie-2017]